MARWVVFRSNPSKNRFPNFLTRVLYSPTFDINYWKWPNEPIFHWQCGLSRRVGLHLDGRPHFGSTFLSKYLWTKRKACCWRKRHRRVRVDKTKTSIVVRFIWGERHAGVFWQASCLVMESRVRSARHRAAHDFSQRFSSDAIAPADLVDRQREICHGLVVVLDEDVKIHSRLVASAVLS